MRKLFVTLTSLCLLLVTLPLPIEAQKYTPASLARKTGVSKPPAKNRVSKSPANNRASRVPSSAPSQQTADLSSVAESHEYRAINFTVQSEEVKGTVYPAAPPRAPEQKEKEVKKAVWVPQQGPSAALGEMSLPTEPVEAASSDPRALGAAREDAMTSLAPTDFKYNVVHDMTTGEIPLSVGGIPTRDPKSILEPSVANMGNTIFYTANEFAARSLDGGNTFTYVNPYTTFPQVNGGFCCDQVTLSAPQQNMIIWELQYFEDAARNNTIRIARAVGSSQVANNTWAYYDFTPQFFGYPSGHSFDFPDMAISANYLYMSENVYTSTGNNAGAVVWRIPLSQLAAGGSINVEAFVDLSGFTFRFTEGASSTMYWGTHHNTSQVKIFRWADNSTSIFADVVNVESFVYLARDGVAISPDGTNWAARAESRMSDGWVANGVIGFTWGAKQDSFFPYPYIILARFSEATRARISQDELWSQSNGWLYPTVGVNSRGNLAGLASYGGGSLYPGANIWIVDDISPSFASLALFAATQSNAGPSTNTWGDYHTVQPHKDFPNTWVAGTYYLNGGRTGNFTVPRYLWFGRERDFVGRLQYYPLPSPVRLLDTRAGFAACDAPGTPLTAGVARTEPARTTCAGIPANAMAIVGNAAVVNSLTPSAPGFVTLYPSSAARPTAANVNYEAGAPVVVSNAFTVGLSTSGAFNIYAQTGVHFVVDVTGYYAPPAAGSLYYHPLPAPVRLLDTRSGQPACDAPGAPLTSRVPRTEVATIPCTGIPAGARALVGNAAVVNSLTPSAPGFITLYPSSAARPTAANVNYEAGGPVVVSNAFTVGLSTSGAFNIYAQTGVHFVVDVTGYYSDVPNDANGAGLHYYGLPAPVRLLDTRFGQPACDAPGAPLTAGVARTEPATTPCTSVPIGARALVGNAAVVNSLTPSAPGFITLYPSSAARPTAANVNYEGRGPVVVSNAFTVGLSTGGAFNIYANTSTHMVVDLSGYFAQ